MYGNPVIAIQVRSMPRVLKGVGSGLAAGYLCQQIMFSQCDKKTGPEVSKVAQRPVVIVGPSGVGKGTLLGRLMVRFDVLHTHVLPIF